MTYSLPRAGVKYYVEHDVDSPPLAFDSFESARKVADVLAEDDRVTMIYRVTTMVEKIDEGGQPWRCPSLWVGRLGQIRCVRSAGHTGQHEHGDVGNHTTWPNDQDAVEGGG